MCELNVLDQETFDAIVVEYPSFKFKMERLAYRRQSKDRRHTMAKKNSLNKITRKESDIVQQQDLLEDLNEEEEEGGSDDGDDDDSDASPLAKEVKDFVRRTSKAINTGQGTRGSIIDVPLRQSIQVDKPNFFGHEDDGQLAVLQSSEYRRISKSPALLAAAVSGSPLMMAQGKPPPPRSIFSDHKPSFVRPKSMKRSNSNLGSIVEGNNAKDDATTGGGRGFRLDSVAPTKLGGRGRKASVFAGRGRRGSSSHMAFGAQAFLARMDPNSPHTHIKG